MKRLALLFSLMMFFFLGVVHAQDSKEDVLPKFIAGNIFYKDGNFDEAIREYERVLEAGWESAPLYYNLGNAYYKKGKTGQAVLNYERSLRLAPRDSDLMFNYTFIADQKGLYNQKPSGSTAEKMIRGYLQFYNFGEMVFALSALVFLLGCVYLLSLYLRWPEKTRKVSTAVITVLLILCGAALIMKAQSGRNFAVVMQAGESRFEPRQESTVHFKLPEGSKVKIVKEEEAWVKIKRADGKLGWAERGVMTKI